MSLTYDTNDLETFYYHQDTANLAYVVYLTSLLKPEVLHHLHILQFVYNSNHNMVLRRVGLSDRYTYRKQALWDS
jgi:hypothetical protein